MPTNCTVVKEGCRESKKVDKHCSKGLSINDFTALGGGGQVFFDNSAEALELKSVTMGEGEGGQNDGMVVVSLKSCHFSA